MREAIAVIFVRTASPDLNPGTPSSSDRLAILSNSFVPRFRWGEAFRKNLAAIASCLGAFIYTLFSFADSLQDVYDILIRV